MVTRNTDDGAPHPGMDGSSVRSDQLNDQLGRTDERSHDLENTRNSITSGVEVASKSSDYSVQDRVEAPKIVPDGSNQIVGRKRAHDELEESFTNSTSENSLQIDGNRSFSTPRSLSIEGRQGKRDTYPTVANTEVPNLNNRPPPEVPLCGIRPERRENQMTRHLDAAHTLSSLGQNGESNNDGDRDLTIGVNQSNTGNLPISGNQIRSPVNPAQPPHRTSFPAYMRPGSEPNPTTRHDSTAEVTRDPGTTQTFSRPFLPDVRSYDERAILQSLMDIPKEMQAVYERYEAPIRRLYNNLENLRQEMYEVKGENRTLRTKLEDLMITVRNLSINHHDVDRRLEELKSDVRNMRLPQPNWQPRPH